MKMVVFTLECLIDCVQKCVNYLDCFFLLKPTTKTGVSVIYFKLCYDFNMFLSVKGIREVM